MTRITAHSLGGTRLVVCGDDGRRWILDAPAAEIHSAGVRAALDDIRGSGPDVDIAVHRGDVEVGSLEELGDLSAAKGGGYVASWRYAGRLHRARLEPESAAATVDLVGALLRAGVGDPAVATALAEPPLLADPLRTRVADQTTAESTAESDVLERWEGDGWAPHRLRPAPAVDPVTGILRRIVQRPPEPWHPRGFRHLHAELPHLTSIDPRFQPDALAPAASFGDEPDASRAGVLSGVAHYCGAYLGQGRIRRATAQELRADGDRVLTVAEWRPHDPLLHTVPGFPFVRDDDRAVTWWLAGEEVDETCWAPLSLVHAGYLSSRLPSLRATNDHNLVGLQAGVDLDDATERAAAHVIAHDAVARWWSNPSPLPESAPPAGLRGSWDASPLRMTVLSVPSSTGLPVRLVVADDVGNDIIGLGFATALDGDEAATKAASDALVQYASARDLDSSRSLIRDAESIGNGGVAGLAAFDPDRRYAEIAFADARALTDPMCHVQYGLSRSSVARVRERTRPRGVAPVDDPAGSAFDALLASGERVVVVDVTTARVREAGFAACRLLAPAFERLTPAAFPRHLSDPVVYPGW